MRARRALLVLLAGCSSTAVAQLDPADGGALPDAAPVALPRPRPARDAEAPADASPPPAPRYPPVPGTWRALPQPHPKCENQYAVDPEVAVPAMSWTGCASMKGCFFFTADWDGRLRERLRIEQDEPAIIDGVPHFVFRRQYFANPGVEESHWIWAVQPLDGPARAAVQVTYGPEPDVSCDGQLRASSTGFVFDALGEQRKTSNFILQWFDWAEPRWTLHQRVGPEGQYGTPGTNGAGGVVMNGDWMFIPQTPGLHINGSMVVWNRATEQLYWPDVPSHHVAMDAAIAVDGGAFLIGDGRTWRNLFFLPNTGGARVIWSAAAPRVAVAHRLDRGDGNTLVWTDGTLGTTVDVDNIELWTSPFATRAEDMRPRRVAKLRNMAFSGLIANAGVVAYLDDEQGVHIVRRSDGRGWRVPTHPEFVYVHPIWVDDEHVWLLGSNNPSVRHRGWTMDSIIRFDRAGLGEPTEPSGL